MVECELECWFWVKITYSVARVYVNFFSVIPPAESIDAWCAWLQVTWLNRVRCYRLGCCDQVQAFQQPPTAHVCCKEHRYMKWGYYSLNQQYRHVNWDETWTIRCIGAVGSDNIGWGNLIFLILNDDLMTWKLVPYYWACYITITRGQKCKAFVFVMFS